MFNPNMLRTDESDVSEESSSFMSENAILYPNINIRGNHIC
jgi:hypothetical protein